MTDFREPPRSVGSNKAFGTDLEGPRRFPTSSRWGSRHSTANLLLPVMTLKPCSDRAQCRPHGTVSAPTTMWNLAPHAKTTMSPRTGFDGNSTPGLGRWTAATVAQARILREFGVDTIIIASQVSRSRRYSVDLRTPRPPTPIFFVTTLVDSVESVPPDGTVDREKSHRPAVSGFSSNSATTADARGARTVRASTRRRRTRSNRRHLR